MTDRPAPMKAATAVVLVGLACATALAWRLGGAAGTGVLVGFVSGAAITGLGLAWQAQVARTRPAAALNAAVLAFLAKLAVLLIGALAFRYVEPAARRVDYQSFLVAFAVTAAALLVAGVPGTLSVLARRRAL